MIYLDHNATTPLHPDVRSKMDKFLQYPMNSSSIHSYGRKALALLENARKSIANLLGFVDIFRDYQVIFTSSGTEANNLVISNFINDSDSEVFLSAIEHHSIYVYKDYANVIKVNKNGILDMSDLESKLKRSKAKKKLVSVMLANNETGIIQPIKKISQLAHNHGAFMHSDSIQAVGKIKVDIQDLNLDFMSVASHKFGGAIGAAALIKKSDIALKPLILGGGQEKNMRAGTENVPAIIGFGEAASIAQKDLSSQTNHMKELRDELERNLRGSDLDVDIVGIDVDRLPNTSLIINKNKNAETQLIALDLKGVAVSSGSACSSGKTTSSHVLTAMGYEEGEVDSAIRISLGRSSTKGDIEKFFAIYKEING